MKFLKIGLKYCEMEGDLQEDLAEILKGFDPMEHLLQDPTLAKVAEEMCDQLNGASDPQPTLFGQITLDEHSPSTESTDSYNSGFELATHSKVENSVNTRQETSCVVCGRPAGGHLNYGVVTCNSCRAFFSRSYKNNEYKNFVCVNVHLDSSNMCKIVSASWKNCKKCRFKRCQQLGMKMKGKSLYEVSGGSSAYHGQEHLRMALTLTEKLTNEDRSFIRSMVTKRVECKMECRGRLHKFDPEHLRIRLKQSYHGQAMSLKDFKVFEDFLVHGQIQNFSEGEFSADGMTKKDRVRLLCTNLPLAMEFFEAYRIEIERWKKYDPIRDLEYLVKDLDINDKNVYYKMHKEVTQNGSLEPKKVSYESTYNHQEMGILYIQEAQKHKKAVDKIVSLSLNEPDPVLPMLISSLIIYSSDSVDLDHPGSAERLQLNFASLLHR